MMLSYSTTIFPSSKQSDSVNNLGKTLVPFRESRLHQISL